MATTPFAPIRSISMPSRSHPLSTRIEDELTKLRAWAELAAAAPRPESLCKGLNHLAHLHALVDDLLHLPANQQAIHRLRGEKCVEELLSGYVALLDATSATSGEVEAMKEQAADVLSALRRRGADVAVTRNVEAYIRSRKNSKKVLTRCLKVVKQMEENYPCLVSFQEASREGIIPSVVGLLREVKAVSAVILVSLLQFFLSTAPNSSKWAFVSKVILKGRTQAEEEKQGEANGLSGSDAAIHLLHRQLQSKNVEVGTLRVAQKRLADIEMTMGSLETGLEAIFRGLIQNRVSLLNSLSL